jgi:hypothetical protein
MTFDEVLDQVRELLQQRGQVTYRSLKLRYQLDDELLVGVTEELINAERVAIDEDGKVLVWIGKEAKAEAGNRGNGETEPMQTSQNPQPANVGRF